MATQWQTRVMHSLCKPSFTSCAAGLGDGANTHMTPGRIEHQPPASHFMSIIHKNSIELYETNLDSNDGYLALAIPPKNLRDKRRFCPATQWTKTLRPSLRQRNRNSLLSAKWPSESMAWSSARGSRSAHLWRSAQIWDNLGVVLQFLIIIWGIVLAGNKIEKDLDRLVSMWAPDKTLHSHICLKTSWLFYMWWFPKILFFPSYHPF